MNQYKVYFINDAKPDFAFVDAVSLMQAKFKILSRFNFAVVTKIVSLY